MDDRVRAVGRTQAVAIERPGLRRVRMWALAVLVIAGAIYTATAARDILVGDTAEFLTAALTLGVAHPSGYPLLVLLGRLFTWLPVGDLPFRANLVAVAASTATVTFVFLTARRLGVTNLAAAIAALALAVHPLFWEWSLSLEAFPLNSALAAAVIYFLVRWDAESARSRDVILAALCGALGVANHLTIVFLIPASAIMLWRHRTSAILARLRTRLAIVAVIVVGVLPYAYIPWAASHDPYLNWGAVTSPTALLAHFLRTDYGTFHLVAPGAQTGSGLQRLMALCASFTWLEAALVVLGAAVAARRVPWFFWCTLLTFALVGPGFALMANMDPVRPPTALWVLRRFFLLPHVVLAPLAAFGVESLVRAMQDGARSRRLVSAAVACTLMIVLVVGVVRNYPVMDQRRNHLARTFAGDILVSLEPRSVLLASGDEVLFPLAYLQAVEHKRPDVTVVAVGLLWRYEWYLEVLRRRDPHLRVPFEWSDVGRRSATLEALVKANADRPFAFVGEPEDDGSLRDTWFFRRGLVAQLEPWQREVSLEAFVAENERLLRLYRVPDAGAIKHKTFEDSILARYAHVAVTVGRRYALTYRNTEAEAWYRRALSIDPGLSEARAALAQLTGPR